MIKIFDIGGRFGRHRAWQDFGLPIDYFCFEADAEEARRLAERCGERDEDGCRFQVIDAAVAEKTGEAQIYLYEKRDLSSLYPLSPGVSYRYGDVKLDGVVTVATTTLDAIAAERNIRPDFLSIDAQGATIRILDGGPETVADILGIRCEMEFFPLYKGAPLADTVMTAMRAAGYDLLRLEMCGPPLYGISTEMNAFSISPWDGRPSSCDAIYVNTRRIERLLDAPMAPEAAERLLYAFAFCVHNGGGYYGAALLERLAQRGELAAVLATQPAALVARIKSLAAFYLALPRTNVNANFDGGQAFHALFGEALAAQPPLAAAQAAKLNKIYGQEFRP